MKKIFSTAAIACALFTSVGVFAQGTKNAGQDAATNKGDVLLDFGVGLVGNEYSYSSSNNKYTNESHYQLPTFSVALQKAFWEDITIGGQISINNGGSKYDSYHQGDGYYRTNIKNTHFTSYFTARGEYHFNRLIGLDPKFDLYAGALAGFSITNEVYRYDEGYDGSNGGNAWGPNTHKSASINTGGVVGPFGGFRYYFGNNIGVYGEVGWAITAIRAGLVWKL
ncbi:MAG: hypothetical protein ACTHJT_01170 [Cytophaga sp.]|uniref:hypothetical protein n=1 Tax=Cytophaga sp. TaxID=29535 RepID=UPI003F800762